MPCVLVIGGGELGSAVSHRLMQAGMCVFIVDLEEPRCIRRNVCFATARYTGVHQIEGVTARKAGSVDGALTIAAEGAIPVLAGDADSIAAGLKPDVVVDARMLKRECNAHLGLASLVVGLGPGFNAGVNAHAVIETMRGHNLGRVIYDGCAEAHTGIPAAVMGVDRERVVRAPGDGIFQAGVAIGTIVSRESMLGTVDGTVPVKAGIGGMVRGLVADGLRVRKGQKMGDIDPRGDLIDPDTISDKGRAVAGGVLEAIMHWWMVSRHE